MNRFASNAFLIDHFLRERDAAVAEGHKGHVIHNKRMAKIIKALPRDLKRLADLDGIKGVGPKARETIAALLKQRDAEDVVVPGTPPTSKPSTPQAPKAVTSAQEDRKRALKDNDLVPGVIKRRRVRFRRALFAESSRQRASVVKTGSQSDDGDSDSLSSAFQQQRTAEIAQHAPLTFTSDCKCTQSAPQLR